MAEWDRVLQATHNKYVKGVIDETLEHRLMFWTLKKMGKIKYNQFGDQLTWRVKKAKRTLNTYDDGEQVTFQRVNLYASPALPWRGYTMEDMITKKERLMNKGDAAIFKVYDSMVESMREDFTELLNAEFWRDGNATGMTSRFHGIESIFGYTASTASYATSNESYAGITMSAVYGTNSATSYFCPCLHDEHNTVHTWASAPLTVVRYTIQGAIHGNTPKGRPTMVVTDKVRYLDFKAALQAEEEIMAGDRDMTYAGFQNVTFDGIPVTFDEDHAASCLHALNFNHIELNILGSQLIEAESEYDIGRKAFVFSMDTFGNFKINPRFQAKSADFSA